MNIYRCSDPEQNPISHWFSEPNNAPALAAVLKEMMPDHKQEEAETDGFFPSFYRPSGMM